MAEVAFTILYNHHFLISRTFLLSQTETLYQLNNNFPFLVALASDNPYAAYCFEGLLQVPHVTGIIQYLFFHVWFIHFSKTILRFMHVVICIIISFLFKAELYNPLYGYTIFGLSNSSTDRYLCYFHLLAIVTSTAVQVSVWISAFNTLGRTH